ncbi:MAG: hypothetical protein GY953_01970 [bacterium]|nr:hypothetical protein [bacterium]
MSAGATYQILEWAEGKGEVKAVDRIRLMTMADAIREGVNLAKATPETEASDNLISAIRKAASEVVGESCPF